MTQGWLADRYYSLHYKDVLANVDWEWVLKRIELNFGGFFDTISPEGYLLDIACGVGYLESYLLARGYRFHIDAVDLSSEQLYVAQNKLLEQGFGETGNVSFYCKDAMEFVEEAAEGKYAIVTCIDFIEHLAKVDIIRFLRLCHKILVPGGLILLRAPNAENPM